MSQLYQLFTVGICIFLTEYKDTIGFDYFILKPKKKKYSYSFCYSDLKYRLGYFSVIISTQFLLSYNVFKGLYYRQRYCDCMLFLRTLLYVQCSVINSHYVKDALQHKNVLYIIDYQDRTPVYLVTNYLSLNVVN